MAVYVDEMILYALASRQVQETVDLFSTREEAEAAVRVVVQDEPLLAPDIFVAEIEDPSPNELRPSGSCLPRGARCAA